MNSQIKEYDHTKFKAVIAVDFDFTLCKSEYPACGPEIKDAGYYMRKLANEGYGIVINTCRAGLSAAKAIKWLHKNEIPYHYFNCNFPHLIELYSEDCRKISANIYVDDKNVGGFIPWDAVYCHIHNKFGKVD